LIEEKVKEHGNQMGMFKYLSRDKRRGRVMPEYLEYTCPYYCLDPELHII
jgi:hypothetical protein